MSSRAKLKHFAQMKHWDHVIEAPNPYDLEHPDVIKPYYDLPGKWKNYDLKMELFEEDGETRLLIPELGASKREKPYRRVILELACGKGFYTLELARRYPEDLVIGIDIKGSRLWHGGVEVMEQGLDNAKFFRTRIEELNNYFKDGEVDEIWVTFPDPHPREGREKRRLTSQRFLDIYHKLLKSGGVLNLKTDNTPLFEFSLEMLEENKAQWNASTVIWNVYEEKESVAKWESEAEEELGEQREDLLFVKTDYERLFSAKGETIKFLSVNKRD